MIMWVGGCCRRRQIDPCAGILLTQPKTLRNVAYNGVALISGGSVKIGSLGQKRVGANSVAEQKGMNAEGGKDKLDNRRNEIAEKYWGKNGIE